MQLWLFSLGLALGSFIKVLADRYDPEKFLITRESLGGRSACPRCGSKLNWFELIPLLSFLFLRARCRNCRAKISFEYPLSEILSGLIFVVVPSGLSVFLNSNHWLLVVIFLLVFETLLLISLIDFRLKLIPNEANLFLIFLGALIMILTRADFGLVSGSFLGPSAAIFGLKNNIWFNHLGALIFGAAFFGALVLVTRGMGMGMGDLKLAAALGVIFGWPDIVLLILLAFVFGSIFSLPGIIFKKRGLKSLLPFGPFLALASMAVFLFGENIVNWYFNLFPV